MHIHKFKIDEVERRARKDVYHHMRRFVTVYSKNPDVDQDSVEKFEGHIETIVQKPKPTFSARFHVGNAGSETPFDGHLTIFGTGLYWGISLGRNLAQFLTSNKEHPYDGRDISLSVHDGSLWVRAWTPPDRWQRGEFAKWRDASVSLNPLDHIYGPLRYSYEDIAEMDVVLQIPGDIEVYPVTLKLQKQSFGRAKSKRRIISYSVDVNARKGIPAYFDHSGGWKGDRVYGFSVAVKNHKWNWEIDAKNLVIAEILRMRGNSGFREPQEVNI